MSVISSNDIVVNYRLGNAAELDGLVSKLNAIDKEEKDALETLRQFNNQVKKTGNEGKESFEKVSNSAKKTRGEFDGLGNALKGVGGMIAGAFAIGSIIAFGKEVIRVTAEYEQLRKAIDFASGSQIQGNANFELLRETANKYGLDLMALTEGYKGFAASSNLAGTANKETNRQFIAVAKAAAVLGLGSERTKLILAGLSQIASKGTVSMEELRQQIGDSLPGALGIASRAMGMTIAEFTKMVAKGEIASKDFLPRFATELEKTFGADASKNLATLTASQNKFNTSIDTLIVAIGEKLQPFLKGAYDLAAGIANQLSGIGQKAKQQTAENIAAKKVEADLAQKIFKVSQDQGIWISRQAAARALIFDLEKSIDEQFLKNANLKILAAGSLNNKTKQDIKDGEKKLAVLQAELAIVEQIAGVTVTNGKEVVKLTEDEYQAKLKLLDLEEQIEILRAKNRFRDQETYLAKEYQIRKKYSDLKIALDLQADKAGVEGAKDSARLRTAQINLQKTETISSLSEITKSTKDEIEKQLRENEAFDQKRGIAQKEQAKQEEEANKEKVDSEIELAKKIKEIYEKSNEDKEKLTKQLEDIDREAFQRTFDFAQTLVNGLYNIRQQQISNEITLLNRRADEEVRLADGNAQKIAEIEEKRRTKEKELRIKAFRAEQQQAIANIIFSAAPEIIKNVKNPLILGLIAAQVLLQTGLVLAQPVPEFAKGVKNFEGGLAKVGEEGSELIKTPKGVYLSPNKPTLTFLPKGTDVITASKTREILSFAGKQPTNTTNQMIDVSPIAKAVSSIPVQSFELSEKGIRRFVKRGNTTTQILNKTRGANL